MEWKKVWRNKKIIGILAGLFCFQMVFFFYNTNQIHQRWERVYLTSYTQLHQQEEAAYIESFQSTIEGIVKQADTMSGISIFSQTDSFSSRNVEKTKEDFTALLSVKPVLFENVFLTDFFADTTRNLVTVIAMALITLVYIDENKPGLRCMIFATSNGRSQLVLNKITALFLWALFISMVFGGGNLLAGSMYYGENVLDYAAYPIQSLSMFGNLPWKINIGSFLLVYLAYQGLVLFLIGLGIWSILFCVEYLLLSIGAVGAIGIITYLLYKLIDSKHPLNVLHYCNPWYLVSGSSIFAEYKNLNIAEQAVNKNTAILVFYLLTAAVFGATVFAAGTLRYPCSSTVGRVKQLVKSMAVKVKKAVDERVSRLSLTGMEFYKVLIGQKGIFVIVVLAAVFVYQADFTNIQLSARQEMYFHFMERHEGVPDEASWQEMEELETLLAEVETTYLEAAEAYEKGEMSAGDWIFHTTRYLDFEQDRKFLEEIQNQTNHITELESRRGISAWYVNCYSYNKLLSEGSTLVNILLVFGTLLLSSGVFVTEKKAGMLHTIRSSLLGRTDLSRKKFHVAYVLTLFLFLVISLLEFGTVAYAYGFSGWAAPVQSIMQLGSFPVNCSIAVFFLGFYLVKAVVLLAITTGVGMFFVHRENRA